MQVGSGLRVWLTHNSYYIKQILWISHIKEYNHNDDMTCMWQSLSGRMSPGGILVLHRMCLMGHWIACQFFVYEEALFQEKPIPEWFLYIFFSLNLTSYQRVTFISSLFFTNFSHTVDWCFGHWHMWSIDAQVARGWRGTDSSEWLWMVSSG